jgi:hypothetical protein
MIPTDIAAKAKALYEASTLSAPRWDQLSETKKQVWRNRIWARYAGDLI